MGALLSYFCAIENIKRKVDNIWQNQVKAHHLLVQLFQKMI